MVFLGVIPVCYVSVSLAGVVLFGADTPEDILVEFQKDSMMEAVFPFFPLFCVFFFEKKTEGDCGCFLVLVEMLFFFVWEGWAMGGFSNVLITNKQHAVGEGEKDGLFVWHCSLLYHCLFVCLFETTTTNHCLFFPFLECDMFDCWLGHQ